MKRTAEKPHTQIIGSCGFSGFLSTLIGWDMRDPTKRLEARLKSRFTSPTTVAPPSRDVTQSSFVCTIVIDGARSSSITCSNVCVFVLSVLIDRIESVRSFIARGIPFLLGQSPDKVPTASVLTVSIGFECEI